VATVCGRDPRHRIAGRLDAPAAEALRLYAPVADEIGAREVHVDDARFDLLVPGTLVAVDLERAMRAMAWRLLRRFGWRDDDLVYVPNLRNAQTGGPPARPPATALVVERTGHLGNDGETYGADVGPAHFFEVGEGGDAVLARLFVTVPAATVTAAVDALQSWLSRAEPVAAGLERLDGDRFRAGLLWRTRGPLVAEAERLGLTGVETRRIGAGAENLVETATAADGTALWLRRGADPLSPPE
jgi:hypothetical protein